MKLEEALPALREGKKIRRKDPSWINFYDCIYVNCVGKVMPNRAYFEDYTLDTEDLDADDWEIVEETKKVKLRDLTWEQYTEWVENHCQEYNEYCDKCPFQKVKCENDGGQNSLWINNKDLYSDKFLDKEVEIEEE